ncbi:MAG: SufD family Fe-S cluster assembly protein [Rickettsiales bacterium]|jgi:hypothetical protein|nr:SufD family Fe-S cluster assembly protein [Rickettsiales bacterium]
MTYLFDFFKNMRTFHARTRVYRNGLFAPELSDESGGANLPLHIMHVGRISGSVEWRIAADPQKVFLTARLEVSDSADLHIIIDASERGAFFDGLVFCKNAGIFTLTVEGNNNADDTEINCAARIVAGSGSSSDLSGVANIAMGVKGAKSDINFAALLSPKALALKMSPAQRISSAPLDARHGAYIYSPGEPEMQYLETAGLSGPQAESLLERVFMGEA